MTHIRPFLLAMALLSISLASAHASYPGIVSVTCQNATTDASTLNTAIAGALSGSQIQIHGTCLVNATIQLVGNMSYIGDSRTGTIIQQANGANLPAVVASSGWYNNTTTVDAPITLAHLTINGNSALRNTCFHSTRRSDKPFARAVSTYCLRISSRNAFLVSIVITAKFPTTEATTGNVMCHR